MSIYTRIFFFVLQRFKSHSFGKARKKQIWPLQGSTTGHWSGSLNWLKFAAPLFLRKADLYPQKIVISLRLSGWHLLRDLCRFHAAMSLLGSLLKKANPPTKAEADSLHFGEAAASVRKLWGNSLLKLHYLSEDQNFLSFFCPLKIRRSSKLDRSVKMRWRRWRKTPIVPPTLVEKWPSWSPTQLRPRKLFCHSACGHCRPSPRHTLPSYIVFVCRYMGPNLWDEVLTFGESSTLEFLNAEDFLFETGILLEKDSKKSSG